MTLDQVEAHLDALGWAHKRHDERTLACPRSSSEGELRIFVRVSAEWFVASVVPFLRTQGDNSFELVRWLLRQNRDLYQAKFATDEDGDVVLAVEMPTESLDRGEIHKALTNLVAYAVDHRSTLRRAAGLGA